MDTQQYEVKEFSLPVLTLEPVVLEEVRQTLNQATTANINQVAKQLEQFMSEEEKKAVTEFAGKIDLQNTNMILQYGAAAQTKIASFSEQTLEQVRTKDLGEVGQLMTSLVSELKGFSIEEKKGIFSLFQKASNQIAILRARYNKADVNIDNIVNVLEQHQVTLMKDIAVLDEMYRLNVLNFKELSMYILAGKQRLEQFKANELAQAMEKAAQSNEPGDAQYLHDLNALVTRFEKKIHDLELTRAISIQMAPQIRLVQNNDSLMVEKIQSSLVNTIPLWKSQMVLALGLANSKKAMEAQKEVTDFTNQLLRKNAEILKQGTIEIAKESERGIVELDTIKHTNEQLMSTLDEVLRIQEEGRAKRVQASQELLRIEHQLKQKLMDVRN